MKAIVCAPQYGPLDEMLRLADVAEPTISAGRVRVQVHAAGLNPLDWHCITGTPRLARIQMGMRRPKVTGLGVDFSGTVVEVGDGVRNWSVGDAVFGMTDGVGGLPNLSAVAEQVVVDESSVHAVPDGITFEQAAGVGVAGTTALRGIRDVAAVKPGDHVLVTGASGGVGSFAVQMAVAMGAEVTAECSGPNVELVTSLGASRVIDYTTEDVTRLVQNADVVLDNVGSHPPRSWRRVLAPKGVYIASYGSKHNTWLGPFGSMAEQALVGLVSSQRFAMLPSTSVDEELATVATMLADGSLVPVVGRTYAMADAAAAMEHVATGHVRGKIVVTIKDM